MELIITNRKGEKFTVLYDECDKGLIDSHNWYVDSKMNVWTAIRVVVGKWKRVTLHRMIFGLFDPSVYVDHIHHNRLDNRRSELRICNAQQSVRNRRSNKNSKSKYLGVTIQFNKRKDGGITGPYYRAGIGIDRKYIKLGYFKTEEEAARAYDEAARIHFKEFANVNFS